MTLSNIIDDYLPDGWAKAVLPEFADIVMGQSPTSDTYNTNGIGLPFFQGKAEFGNLHPTVAKYCSKPNKIAKAGATLLSVRAPVGPTNLAYEDCCIGRGLAAIHPIGDIQSKFILYLLRSIEPSLSKEGTGSTFKAINKKLIETISFGLPPLNEQHRIVAKIEELFSELEKGVESLKAAKAQLAVYRQSVLKVAFEGRLTESWRAKHTYKLESADALLARIKTEREARYETQLAEWKASGGMIDGGKKAPKPKKPKELSLLTADELADLPELPEVWGWVRYGDMCSVVRNGVSAKPEGNVGVKIFRISAVRAMQCDMEDYRYIDNSSGEFDGYFLQRGDIVFTRYNGSRQYVGVSAVYSSEEKRLFPDKLIQTRLDTVLVDPHFIEKASNSGDSRAFIEQRIRTTAGQSGVAGSDIKAMPVPICSPLEQQQIVQEIESRFSVVEKMEQTIEESLQKAEALRQSILKRAFEGKLVPQDPSDVPASELLARIRAEREASPKKRRKSVANVKYA